MQINPGRAGSQEHLVLFMQPCSEEAGFALPSVCDRIAVCPCRRLSREIRQRIFPCFPPTRSCKCFVILQGMRFNRSQVFENSSEEMRMRQAYATFRFFWGENPDAISRHRCPPPIPRWPNQTEINKFLTLMEAFRLSPLDQRDLSPGFDHGLRAADLFT